MTEKENNNNFEFLEAIPFKTKAIKVRFHKELNEIKLNHEELFNSFPNYITDVSSFLIIRSAASDGIIYSFTYENLLSEDLRADILNFLNSFGTPLNE